MKDIAEELSAAVNARFDVLVAMPKGDLTRHRAMFHNLVHRLTPLRSNMRKDPPDKNAIATFASHALALTANYLAKELAEAREFFSTEMGRSQVSDVDIAVVATTVVRNPKAAPDWVEAVRNVNPVSQFYADTAQILQKALARAQL